MAAGLPADTVKSCRANTEGRSRRLNNVLARLSAQPAWVSAEFPPGDFTCGANSPSNRALSPAAEAHRQRAARLSSGFQIALMERLAEERSALDLRLQRLAAACEAAISKYSGSASSEPATPQPPKQLAQPNTHQPPPAGGAPARAAQPLPGSGTSAAADGTHVGVSGTKSAYVKGRQPVSTWAAAATSGESLTAMTAPSGGFVLRTTAWADQQAEEDSEAAAWPRSEAGTGRFNDPSSPPPTVKRPAPPPPVAEGQRSTGPLPAAPHAQAQLRVVREGLPQTPHQTPLQGHYQDDRNRQLVQQPATQPRLHHQQPAPTHGTAVMAATDMDRAPPEGPGTEALGPRTGARRRLAFQPDPGNTPGPAQPVPHPVPHPTAAAANTAVTTAAASTTTGATRSHRPGFSPRPGVAVSAPTLRRPTGDGEGEGRQAAAATSPLSASTSPATPTAQQRAGVGRSDAAGVVPGAGFSCGAAGERPVGKGRAMGSSRTAAAASPLGHSEPFGKAASAAVGSALASSPRGEPRAPGASRGAASSGHVRPSQRRGRRPLHRGGMREEEQGLAGGGVPQQQRQQQEEEEQEAGGEGRMHGNQAWQEPVQLVTRGSLTKFADVRDGRWSAGGGPQPAAYPQQPPAEAWTPGLGHRERLRVGMAELDAELFSSWQALVASGAV